MKLMYFSKIEKTRSSIGYWIFKGDQYVTNYEYAAELL